MNDYNKRYLIERLGDDHRSSRRDRRDYENDYEDDYEDERRGVKGSGRMRRRDRAYDGRRDYDEEDMYDERRMDGHHLKLSKSKKNRWRREMENTDGTKGEHFDMQEVIAAANKLNVRFDDFTEKDFCLITNMFYSDYGHVIKKFAGQEKELLLICAEFAKAYFDDPDGIDPEEKIAINYCMTDLE